MNITESNAVNVLVRAMFPDVRNAPPTRPTPGAVYEAAHFLLVRATDALNGAGLKPSDLPVPEADQ